MLATSRLSDAMRAWTDGGRAGVGEASRRLGRKGQGMAHTGVEDIMTAGASEAAQEALVQGTVSACPASRNVRSLVV